MLPSRKQSSVLHYMIESTDMNPARLSGTGYGEYHPVTSNDSAEGRQQNRRVEIVILPKVVKEAGSVEAGDENYK